MKLRNIKVSVTEASSAYVQRALFKDGCFWESGRKAIMHEDKGYLFVNESGLMTMSDECDHYSRHANKAVSFQDVINSTWNGTGLPPVGCECEWLTGCGWEKCRVVCVDGGAVFAWTGEGETETPDAILSGTFRPIRTEAEKQREADKEALKDMLSGNLAHDYILEGIANRLLDAGFTRKPDEQKPQ